MRTRLSLRSTSVMASFLVRDILLVEMPFERVSMRFGGVVLLRKQKSWRVTQRGRRMEGQIGRELRAWNLAEHSTDCELSEYDFTAKVQSCSYTSKETTYT